MRSGTNISISSAQVEGQSCGQTEFLKVNIWGGWAILGRDGKGFGRMPLLFFEANET
jgi:hypothetical protein